MKRIIIATAILAGIAIQGMAQPPHMRSDNDLTPEEYQTRAERRAARLEESKNYGNKIFRFFPLRIADFEGVGLGVDFEAIISKDRKVGVVLPVTYFIGTEFLDLSNQENKRNMFLFSPGIKFYPFGQSKVNYAIGPNLMIGYGSGSRGESTWDPVTGQSFTRYENYTNFRMGILLNNYLNIQFSDQFNFGVEAGLGVRYFDRWNFDSREDYNEGVGATGNFALSFGYRF